ncbi:uncharacterized protein [Argopecten irradians]|uniref:uncharacterized protein n=1 Tax=Argopecten irradians TaxID=31199 RepID=UPI00371B76D7
MRNVFLLCVLVHVIADVTAAKAKAKCGERNHGEKWTDSTYSCLSYICQNGVTHPHYTSCFKNKKCYDVGQKWQNECSSFECVSYTKDGLTYFETKLDMKCTAGMKGTKYICKANGEKWKDGCDFKRCEVKKTEKSQYMAQVINVKTGCKAGKKCYYDGQTWFKDCVWNTCKVTSLYAKTVSVPGCKYNRKCYKIGDFRSYKDSAGCYKYMCERVGQEVGWSLSSAACRYKGKCKDSQSTWRVASSCMEQKCVSTISKDQAKLSIEETPYGCKEGKTCKAIGSTWMDSKCSVHKCSLKYGVAYNDIVRTVCTDRKGVCKDWNSGSFEGLVNKDGKKAVFKNCKCQKDGSQGSKMTCTEKSKQ